MITFSPKVKAIIASGRAEGFYFFHILEQNGSVVRASTTHWASFIASNGVTYDADDYIVSVDPPQLSTTVDRENYKIALADPDFYEAAKAENGMVGKRFEARFGFLDLETGLPLANLGDSLIVYKGKIDGMSASITLEEAGESLTTISCASPVMSLDMHKGIYLSRDNVRARNPKDACCDDIYTGSGSLTFKWGRN